MKRLWIIAIVAIAGLALLEGCKKEPETKPVPEVPKMTEQAEKTVAEGTEAAEKAVAAATEQTICPIMGKPIDKEYFVEYKGRKVYFCCPACIDTFNKDPEKYIKDLPQFKQ